MSHPFGMAASSGADDGVTVAMLENVRSFLATNATEHWACDCSCSCWDEFYAICSPLIRRHALVLGLRNADLEDCVQQVWADLVVSLRQFRYDPAQGRFRSWLRVVTHSKAMNIRRRKHRVTMLSLEGCRQILVAGESDDPYLECQRRDQQTHLRGVLLHLRRTVAPSSFRIFYRRWIMSQSPQYIGDRMGITPRQVTFRLHRIRAKVRSAILRGTGVEWWGRDREKVTSLDIAHCAAETPPPVRISRIRPRSSAFIRSCSSSVKIGAPSVAKCILRQVVASASRGWA